MKNIFIIAFSILLLLSCNNNQNIQLINWETNYNTALEKAIKENKSIMIDFYTDWCTICKIMETNVYLDREIASNINYNFVPLKINAEDNDKKLLTNQYNISAFPTTVFINTNGFIIKKILGYIDTNDLLEEIKNIEEKSENINIEFSNNNPTIEKLKIYIDSEYYKEAIEMYDILTKENKIEKEDIPTYLIDIGTLLFYNEQFDEGIKYFNEVLNNYSNSQKLYEAIYFNGIYKIIMGNKEEGINYLKSFTNSITNDELRNQYIEAIEYYQ